MPTARDMDWPKGIDFAELNGERLARLQMLMKADGLGAMFLSNGANVRYATGAAKLLGNAASELIAYKALVPADGTPIVYSVPGNEIVPLREELGADRVRPFIPWFISPARERDLGRWIDQLKADMKTLGVSGEKLGMDSQVELSAEPAWGAARVTLVDGTATLRRAKLVKTPLEIKLIRHNAKQLDELFVDMVKEVHVGMSERELIARTAAMSFERGFEYPFFAVAAGKRSYPFDPGLPNPNRIRAGDFLIVDAGGYGMGGYFVDISRSFVVGKRPSARQRRVYKECLDVLNSMISAVKPGATTADVAERIPEYLVAEELKAGCPGHDVRAHAIGLTANDGMLVNKAYSPQRPERFEPNMYFAIECEVGEGEDGVRLEHDILVTKDGVEIIDAYPIETLQYL